MIQRIQSIFLLICTILFSLFFFMPLKEVNKDGVIMPLTAFSSFNSNFSYTMTFSVVSGFIFLGFLCSLVTIFSYKQRYVQIRLSYIVIGLTIICALLINLTHSVTAYSSGEVISMTANAMFAGILIFAALAIVYIKKDINLLKKADRIR
ncbi:MAG: DUF4293 family protein [Sphingobacteriaceae bacterium]|jgi:H+/Cl- antiporter ClcA